MSDSRRARYQEKEAASVSQYQSDGGNIKWRAKGAIQGLLKQQELAATREYLILDCCDTV